MYEILIHLDGSPQANERARLGLDLAKRLDAKTRGLVVASVDSGADAYNKVKAGDVIVEIQFEPVETIPQARRAIDLAKSTRPVLVYLSRHGDMTFRSIQR
jgi:S1-C subfamily serine protease